MKLDTDGDLLAAVASSSLGRLAPELIERLADGAALHHIEAGATTHEGGGQPFFELVVVGLLRSYVRAADGRTMTIRYCRPGSLMGTGTLFNEERPAQGNVSAVVDSRVLAMRPAIVQDMATSDVRVTRALLRETSARVAEYINELQTSAMAPVRQRLARHLLDLAAQGQTGQELVARASQQELADAVGTVREIVVRALRDMRERGLVRTGRCHIELLGPAGLYEQSRGP